jgi:hypothetical protein
MRSLLRVNRFSTSPGNTWKRSLKKTGWDLEKTALLLQIPLARVRQKIEKLGLAPEGPGPRAFSHPQDEATKEANDETPQS